MKKKTTLQDMRDILVNSSEGSDRHIWGVVTRKNTNSQGKVTSYEVALGGDEGSMTCRKLAGADVGDTVMVTLTKKGAAIVTGTVDGDKDAENALSAATSAQQTAEAIEDLVGDGDESGIVITTQYYLSTSNTETIGGEWSDTLPTYVAGRYYWTKTVTTYADGSEVESDPILDIASQLTAEVNSVVTAENQHFWHDSSGAYVTKSDKNLSSGYAMKITSQGLLQTYNGNNLMALTSSGLTFYQSNGSTPLASYSSGGAYLYAGGSVAASFTSSSTTVGNDASGSTTTSASLTSSGFSIRMYNAQSRTRFTAFSIGLDGIIPEVTGVSYAPLRFNCGIYVKGTTGIQSQYDITASGTLYGTSVSLSGSGDAVIADSGSIKNMWAVTNAGSGAVNMHIGTQGRIYQTSKSSKRFKNSISEIKLDELDPRHLYDIEVNQFKYNTDYIKNPKDARYDSFVPGFIAEQMYEHYPVAIDLDEEGKPNDWNMKFIIPPMLALIQELNERVKSLEKSLELERSLERRS